MIRFYLIQLIFITKVFSQTITIHGFVRDNSNGEPLTGANVFLKKTSLELLLGKTVNTEYQMLVQGNMFYNLLT